MKTTQIKLIFYTSLSISIIGIFSEYITNYLFINQKFGSPVFVIFSQYLNFLNLQITKNYDGINIFNLSFYILLLFGSLLYIFKKGKETRIIRFVFSVILISNFIKIVFTIFKKFILKINIAKSLTILEIILVLLVSSIICLISYSVIKIISKNKELDIISLEDKGNIKKEIAETNKTQRLVHYLLDNFILVLIFFPLFNYYLIYEEVSHNEIIPKFFKTNFGIIIIIFILRFIYYTFFEILFSATPAKLLTESRVLDYRFNKPTISKIFERTLYRNIPFDNFSFFGKNGWHDTFSYTYVVKEKRAGFKTRKLLWILLIFSLMLFIKFKGIELYQSYQEKKNIEFYNELVLENIIKSVENINSKQVYYLEPLYVPKSGIILKIDSVNKGVVKVRKIISNNLYGLDYLSSADILKRSKNDSTFSMNINYLKKAIPQKKYANYETEESKKYFTLNGIQYKINNIVDLDAPYLKLDTYGLKIFTVSNKVSGNIVIENSGTKCDIISLKCIKGDMKILNKFPVKNFEFKDYGYKDRVLVELKVDNWYYNKQYTLEMTVLAINNKKYTYFIIIDGNNNLKEIVYKN